MTADAADCAPTLRLPASPRIVEVLDDGSLRPGPACGSANCLVGAPGAWGYSDGEVNHVVVGTGPTQKTLDLPSLPSSRFAAHPALRGFVVGDELVGVDRGSEIEIVSASSSRRFPMPELAAGESLAFLRVVDDGVDGVLRVPGHRRRLINFVPRASAPPSPRARHIGNAEGDLVGWFLPAGAEGAASPRAAILTTAGTRIELAPELDGARGASAGDAVFIVAAGQEGMGWLVSPTGATLATLPKDAHVEPWDGEMYVVDLRLPGAVLVLGPRGLEPLIPRGAGDDVTGAPLPHGARIERVEVAAHGGRALLVERMRTRTCTVEDRLVLIDLPGKRAKAIATGDVVRLHPTYSGDRFRFVEADASYETP